jgi:hypothetical protein
MVLVWPGCGWIVDIALRDPQTSDVRGVTWFNGMYRRQRNDVDTCGINPKLLDEVTLDPTRGNRDRGRPMTQSSK